jgi:hypothetical protein
MKLIYHRLYKVDNATNEVSLQEFSENENVNHYIIELLQNVSEKEGDREYLFEENSITMKTFINQIINNENRDIASEMISKRLLQEELKSKEKHKNLKGEIQKGILIISFVEMTEFEYKLILSKADYNEFIEEISGNIKSGLPTKKKIFKSFIANVNIEKEESEISKLVTYDSNTTKAAYWSKEFLELIEIRDDEKNTILAYQAIKKDILEPLKKNHKADYLCLWNATVAYFRGEGEFDLVHYRDNIIGNYLPMDKTLKLDDIKTKINKLPTKYKFDSNFTKKSNVIEDKYKNTIKLSNEIDLIIKHDVANPKKTFVPFVDEEGNEYIGILSPEGYKYANKQQIIN